MNRIDQERTAKPAEPTARAAANEKDEQDLARTLHRSENTGRPLGPVGFVQKFEAALGRRLLPNPGGRPRKAKKTKKPK